MKKSHPSLFFILLISVPKIFSEEIEQRKNVDSVAIDMDSWTKFINKIEDGDSSSIDHALKVREEMDGHFSEEIDNAIGASLSKSPDQVLRQIKDERLIPFVCGGPDVDDARFDGLEKSMAEIQKRMKRVRQLKSKIPKQRARKCLEALEASKKSISKFYGK
jgi:hypothetical protein